MAVKRTKKHKQQNAVKRVEKLSYSMSNINLPKLDSNSQENKNNKSKKKSLKAQRGSVNFDTSYVFKDLTKTLVVTLLVVTVLIAYTVYIK